MSVDEKRAAKFVCLGGGVAAGYWASTLAAEAPTRGGRRRRLEAVRADRLGRARRLRAVRALRGLEVAARPRSPRAAPARRGLDAAVRALARGGRDHEQRRAAFSGVVRGQGRRADALVRLRRRRPRQEAPHAAHLRAGRLRRRDDDRAQLREAADRDGRAADAARRRDPLEGRDARVALADRPRRRQGALRAGHDMYIFAPSLPARGSHADLVRVSGADRANGGRRRAERRARVQGARRVRLRLGALPARRGGLGEAGRGDGAARR